MKISILLLSFIQLISASAQKFTLQDIPLNWSDFNARSSGQNNNAYTATTYVTLFKNYSRLKEKDDNAIFLNIYMNVNKSMSNVDNTFLKTEQPNNKEALLNHEKCHLIIALIHFKKMQDSIGNHHFSFRYKSETDNILTFLFNEVKSMNLTYDEDTNHGLNTDRQLIWEQYLMTQFNRLYTREDKIILEAHIKLQTD